MYGFLSVFNKQLLCADAFLMNLSGHNRLTIVFDFPSGHKS